MTEETAPQELPPLIVNGQYVKDLSFEVPGAPAIYGEMSESPEIPIHVDVSVNPLRDKVFEVVLHVKIEAAIGDKPVFIVELAYGGVFTVNVPEEHVHALLLVECPRLLFPYVRRLISDLTRDGGFPPLMIQPIDFVQLYRARMQRAEAEASAQVGHA